MVKGVIVSAKTIVIFECAVC